MKQILDGRALSQQSPSDILLIYICLLFSAKESTTVTFRTKAGNTVENLEASFYHDYDLKSGTYVIILSSHPVQVAHYCKSYSSYENADKKNIGDPFISLIPSLAQAISDATFSCLDSTGSAFYSFVNIIARTKYIKHIYYDDNLIDESVYFGEGWYPLSGTAYSAVTINATENKQHRLRSNENSPFIGIVYGLRKQESYGLPIGQKLIYYEGDLGDNKPLGYDSENGNLVSTTVTNLPKVTTVSESDTTTEHITSLSTAMATSTVSISTKLTTPAEVRPSTVLDKMSKKTTQTNEKTTYGKTTDTPTTTQNKLTSSSKINLSTITTQDQSTTTSDDHLIIGGDTTEYTHTKTSVDPKAHGHDITTVAKSRTTIDGHSTSEQSTVNNDSSKHTEIGEDSTVITNEVVTTPNSKFSTTALHSSGGTTTVDTTSQSGLSSGKTTSSPNSKSTEKSVNSGITTDANKTPLSTKQALLKQTTGNNYMGTSTQSNTNGASKYTANSSHQNLELTTTSNGGSGGSSADDGEGNGNINHSTGNSNSTTESVNSHMNETLMNCTDPSSFNCSNDTIDGNVTTTDYKSSIQTTVVNEISTSNITNITKMTNGSFLREDVTTGSYQLGKSSGSEEYATFNTKYIVLAGGILIGIPLCIVLYIIIVAFVGSMKKQKHRRSSISPGSRDALYTKSVSSVGGPPPKKIGNRGTFDARNIK